MRRVQVLFHVTTPGTVFDLGPRLFFLKLYIFFGPWIIGRKYGSQKNCSRDIKVHKKDRKCLHRWIGLKNDRQGLPTRCLPDQILCQDGVQRNGSNADALVILGTVVEREPVFWGLARDIMF